MEDALFYPLLLLVQVGLGLVGAIHAMLYKRSPRSAALWIVICVFVPFFGPLAYAVLGVNRTQRRALQRKPRPRFVPAERREGPIELPSPVEGLASLFRLTNRISEFPMTQGNVVEPLRDGDAAFPRMIEAIEGARRSVTCCSYIFDNDETGHRFIEAFGRAVKRGVEVKLLIDGVGGYSYFSRVYRELRKRGATPASFAPLGLSPSRLIYLNLRNHRKLLVVDGRVGFTGGMNISARHLFAGRERRRAVADLHFQLEGPIVAQLQETFADDWRFATGEELEGERFFPPLQAAGGALARGIRSGPDEHLDALFWTVIGACQSARRSLHIMTPYFIPYRSMIASINCAALRGVEVTIYLPRFGEQPFVHWATTAYLWEFLKHGVRVVRHGPPFAHSKLLVVDRLWLLIGSGNLDPRSLRLNFEFNVELYDAALAERAVEYMEETARRGDGEDLTLEKVDNRSLPLRLRDNFTKLFSPYL